MWEKPEIDRHLLGRFQINNEELSGDIIYNKERGTIFLSITKGLYRECGHSFSSMPSISGKLDSGAIVTLYHAACIKNHIQNFAYQKLLFHADYMVFGKKTGLFNSLTCVLENALQWGAMSRIDTDGIDNFSFKSLEKQRFHWFDADICFSTTLLNELGQSPRKEVARVVERLTVEIKSDQKQNVPYFMKIRDKIISLISFAIKDNVNIEKQTLVDFDDFETFNNHTYYQKYELISGEPQYNILGTGYLDYNFLLPELSDSATIQCTLIKLEPIFNLYLSLVKYPHMPMEMVFLNIVQALETFHARFRYDKKDKFIESVHQRFESCENFEEIKSLLLNKTQLDNNINYIILVSRLNDLLIGKNDGLFSAYYLAQSDYAQRIADTRHYYTHYGQSKEEKAFKGDDLLRAILIMRYLLEYSICQELGIDILESIRRQLLLLK